MAWDSKDTALSIQGIGTLASAWGKYETDKTRNKLLKEQLDYEKQKDSLANAKTDMAQKNYDDAFLPTPDMTKKKKKADGTLDLSTDTSMLTA
ncbi:MAG: hypothetical protein IBX43_04935 [Campylobacterales bacterium]|nr:hypothetical protein [Campylobacterales bacterium]